MSSVAPGGKKIASVNLILGDLSLEKKMPKQTVTGAEETTAKQGHSLCRVNLLTKTRRAERREVKG